MSDPYKVLGVSPSDSNDDIKKAYRDLARKYHPDNYRNNPLSDLAQEKMKEINEAYDQITKSRAGRGAGAGGPTGSRTAGQSGTYYGGNSDIFRQVRESINYGNINRAQELLSTVSDRGAEWHFLMGSVYYRMGWMDESYKYFQIAVSMDPTNVEYQQAATRMNATVFNRGGMSIFGDNCNFCTTMICIDCLCKSMRGGCF